MEARTLKEKGVWESKKFPNFLTSILCPFLLISPSYQKLVLICRFYLKNLLFFLRNVSLPCQKESIVTNTAFVVNEDVLI